jgi:hypothetical protein
MGTEEMSEDFFNLVTKEDLISFLQNFKNDKSPRLDGWLVEFYIEFFDLLGMYFIAGSGGGKKHRNNGRRFKFNIFISNT